MFNLNFTSFLYKIIPKNERYASTLALFLPKNLAQRLQTNFRGETSLDRSKSPSRFSY